MASPKLLVIGNTVLTSWGRDQIRRLSEQARRRGITLIGADTPANLEHASAEELARVDEIVPLEVHDPAACAVWAATRTDIDAVLTIRELAVFSTAVLARELGLAGNSPEAVNLIRNKDLCRERLRAAGFRQPAVALCESAEDAERFMRDNAPGPWIVKPRNGLASIGVSRLDSVADLPAALARFGAPPSAMGSLPARTEFLIETFVSGEEFSAEGVMVGGVPQVLALTSKSVADGFVEVGHRVPAGLDHATTVEVVDAVQRALLAAGIARGIFHVEFWTTDEGVVLGELHDRPGGDFIHALVEHTRPGLELYGTLVDDLLGATPALVPASRGAAGAEFLFCPPGNLRAVHGWAELTAHPNVLAADLTIAPGDVVHPVADAFGRHGAFVVGADTAEEVDKLIAELKAQVVFDVE
ncbi:ATP-grasp domain-containing protein [Micromonospora sp. NPDC049559]|uniref:ATP-grasp domain-containing protein n=1 Tax=Micromonospora sp. NPDC049559 TaxID=3155923 RepID=UPI0034398F27